jgi:hypothetical protein
MKDQKFFKVVMCCTLMVMVILSVQASARSSSSSRWRLYGDWQVKIEYDGGQYDSILSFSRNQEGDLTGNWISFMGLSELKDVKYEEGKISFSRTRRSRDGESSTSNFKGTIEDGKISGIWSSSRGENKLEGKRAPRMPRAVGDWEMKYKIGDREITSKLVIKVDKEGNITGQWLSRRGESEVTDLQYERGKLTFKRTSTYQDRKREYTFEGTVQRDNTLTGMIKSERGEVEVEGKLVGKSLIGTWNLEVESERGSRKQRLLVKPDMSALYGAIPIKKINLEDNHVNFLTVLKFRDQSFEIRFDGKIEDSKLTGEITTSRGSQKIKGTKVIRTYRRRNTR